MSKTTWRLAASLTVACGALAWSQGWTQTAGVRIEVLSSMPQLVTGGDALVKISGVDAAPNVTVGGRDVSGAFKSDTKGGWIGLVDGLKDGDNPLVAKGAGREATVTLKNHPINGALFAGPQQTPFLCENEAHGLEKAKDASCAAPSVVKYYYRNRANEWKAFDAAARPNDIGTTKTTEGKTVPLIVRQERGVINRAAYLINILHDPAAGPAPTPIDRGGSAWNGKLIYGYGPGVGTGYRMGANFGHGTAPTFFIEVGGRDIDAAIAGGYAIASGSLNVFGTMPNDVLSAETTAKIKERFIELFGPPMFTIAQGVSGGSMQNQMISNAYPGLLDGIMPLQLYADTLTFLQPLYDCELLVNVFKTGTWTRDQLNAVSGKYWGYCVSNGTRYPNARVGNCNAGVADMVEKDAALKAKGIRCTYQDNLYAVFGTDPKTGFARNPFDNVGVQYGLKALNDGVINFAQFIDINARVGGHDADGKLMPQRQVGDELAIKAAYETGRINSGTGGNKEVPYVGVRTYIDGDPFGRGDPNVDVHDGYHSDIVKARLQKYNGTSANFVYYLAANGAGTYSNTVGSAANIANVEALAQIDKWLTAIVNDKSDRPKAQKVIANKPADFVDTCFAAKGGFDMTAIERITDWNRCKAIFPMSSDARMVAGGPATGDVLKCQMKAIDARDYKVAPSADQMAELRKVFPAGVCDYSKPGVGQTQTVNTWAMFSSNDGKYAQLK